MYSIPPLLHLPLKENENKANDLQPGARCNPSPTRPRRARERRSGPRFARRFSCTFCTTNHRAITPDYFPSHYQYHFNLPYAQNTHRRLPLNTGRLPCDMDAIRVSKRAVTEAGGWWSKSALFILKCRCYFQIWFIRVFFGLVQRY